MNGWIIKYWNEETDKSPIDKWLKKLDKNQVKIVYKQLGFLRKLGNELGLPHSKALGQGLFELREQKYGYRIYYGFQGKLLILLLTAGDKTSQDRDIKVARKRLLSL